MRLDRALSQVQALGDAGVGQPLCHQLEHLAFALRELGKRVVAASNRDQADDDLGIERGSSLDAFGGGKELSDLEDTVFERVAEAAERDERTA